MSGGNGENNGVGHETRFGLFDHTGLETPAVQGPRMPQVQPTASSHSTSSAARIAQLQDELHARDEQLRVRDEQMAEMRRAMQAAGLLPADVQASDGYEEEEEVRSHTRSHTPPLIRRASRCGGSFKTFTDCKPPNFKGGEDALGCVRWLRKMGQTFRSGDFTEDQMVSYAIRMFEGEALEWWDSVEVVLSEATRRALTWETFSQKVKDRYCSDGAMQRVEREFLALQKGSMSIARYNTMFTEKLQFAIDHCPTEVKQIRRYVEGLPFEYRSAVRSQTTLVAAMDEARRIEDDLEVRDHATTKPAEKRKWEGQSGSSKKPDFQQKEGDKSDKPSYCTKCHSSHRGPCSSNIVSCKRCGKMGHRYEDCKSKEQMCYNCRQMGHISNQCPNPKVLWGTGGRKDEVPKAK